jgi:hypothetical protein
MPPSRSTLLFSLLALAVPLASPANGQIPSEQERVQNSTLNPDYTTWRACEISLSEEDAPAADLMACYRKVLDLHAPPRTAAFSILFRSAKTYWVSVNETTIAEPGESVKQLGYLQNYDVTDLLKPGRNVIAIRARCDRPLDSRIAVEGIVHGEDGNSRRILHENWEGGWNLPDGWEQGEALEAGLTTVETGRGPLRGQPTSLPPRPYYGPIHLAPLAPDGIALREPIFDEGSPVRIDVSLLNLRTEEPAPALSLEVFDERRRDAVESREISLAPVGKHDFGAALDLGRLSQGAYRLRFVVTRNGDELDRRDYEIAVVGAIRQRQVSGTHFEGGLELQAVWSVDCTQETNPQTFVAAHEIWKETPAGGVRTEVVDGPAGRYRQLTEDVDRHYFAYQYRVKSLYQPHVAVVQWPDDARRSFCVFIKEPGIHLASAKNLGWQRSEAAVVSRHDLFPNRSGEMKKLHLLFWPNAEAGSIHVENVADRNVSDQMPAAAARISIYEIANDLPALRVAGGGDRMIGPHSERGDYTMASTYYAGPLGGDFVNYLNARDHPEYYRNWYDAAQNFIKRMRFTGMNLYVMGHFMYSGTLYPSEMWRYGYNQNRIGGGDWVRDNERLLLRMFEHNGIHMLSGIEHFEVPHLSATQPTPAEIRAGVEHEFSVTRQGTLFPVHALRRWDGVWWGSGRPREDGSMRWPAMNYFHPKVQERFLALVEELGQRYGSYPAWKGVMIFLSRVMGPMDPALLRSDRPLQVGYEDFTIALFEDETGIDIPVDPTDPKRFEKRYQWIMENGRDRWIDWRCAKYADLYRRLAEKLTAGRDDVKLHLVVGEPMMWSGSQEILDGHYDQPDHLLGILQQFGFDLPALRDDPRIVLHPIYAAAGSGQALNTDGHQGWRELSQNQAWQNLFANNSRGGAYVKNNLSHIGAFTYPEGRWLFTGSGTRQGYFNSTHVAETFVNVLARSNPSAIAHTWMDVAESLGRLQEKREFARAYRSLPNGQYQHLTGNGLDRDIWISRLEKDDVHYAYAANLHWWRPEVTLRFSGGARVHDLIRDTPVKLDGGRWSFRLEPYRVQTFSVTDGRLVSAATEIPERARDYLGTHVAEELKKSQEVLVEAQKRKAELHGKSGWQAYPELESRVARLEAAVDEGRLTSAYRLTQGALPMVRQTIEQVLRGVEIRRVWQ